MIFAPSPAAKARNQLLPAGRVTGPMPWVIAIMMFLTVLAGAAGLALHHGSQALGSDLAGRATVQIVEANAEKRDEDAGRIAQALKALPQVRSVYAVNQADLAEQVRPWLGADMDEAALPIPALIDVELAPGGGAQAMKQVERAAAAVTDKAKVEPYANFLGPLSSLLSTLGLIAVLLVLLMGIATGAVVILAARGAFESHRGTIDILHLMGATDVQVARLFQRRIALDASFGGLIGFIAAIPAIALTGSQLARTQSELLRSVALPPLDWALLALLPIAGIALAILTARITMLRALGKRT